MIVNIAFLIFLCAILTACSDDEAVPLSAQLEENSVNSGYSGSIEDWGRFLSCWEDELLPVIRNQGEFYTPEEELVSERNSLSFEGASDSDIDELEEKIGEKLPSSFEHFLRTSNGWIQINFDAGDSVILAANEVNYLSVREPNIIDNWMTYNSAGNVTDSEYFNYSPSQDTISVRGEYLRSAVAISDSADAGIYLLNPKIRTLDGEWEAWFFGWELPGAIRFPSFAHLMRYAYYKAVHQPETDYYFPREFFAGTCADILSIE